MSNEKETKPRKAPAKKAVASGETKTKAAKPKAAAAPKVVAAPKEAAASTKAKAAPKAKAAAEAAIAAGVPEVARTAKVVVASARPTHHQIAELAYTYYIERGWRHGYHEQDWLRAERILTSR